jgi:class 3 adenylate cyclase/tetratricopeptide (TPR) repeat protein
MPICPRCGEDNPERARFCLACAAPLTATAAAREERKVITVLFADLVGFTGQAEGLDPEDVRALQDPYWRHVRSEIERHGGTVEKFIGDAVVALFGAPVTHEDDPERAVRAALAIRDWAREQAEVQVRIAVTTGEALVRLSAQPLAGEGMASGDVVNTASRLQATAPANSVLVDERSYRSTRQLIDYRDVKPIVAKGKLTPVRVWEALQARSRFGVDVVQEPRTPLVGRERELDLLKDALRRVREERSQQLATLVGLPGIGKSRLVYELMQAVGNDPSGIVTWRQGRSLPYGEGVSFWALGEIVKAQAGILETDTDAQAGAKLARAVQTLIDDAGEAEWVERHLHPLAGLTGESEPASDRRDAFASWRRFFEALADWRPAVLVFEDLHWADEGLLDFVDSLVEWVRDVPLLVVATARPELLERRPAWAGGKANATTLSLSPLSAEETARLVGQLLEEAKLSRGAEQALVEHAAGNALYAEQYTRMWQERERLEQLPPPETVEAIIAARLDALSLSEKTLLQNAAVFGKVFWEGAIIAVNGVERDDVASWMHALERKEFVQRARRSSVEAETEYAFRHVLVRDVAYGQIPRAARAEKHERAAAWIESLGRRDDHAEMLAHHCTRAFELTLAAGRSDDALAARARDWLVHAGDRALAVNAFRAGAQYYRRALELSREGDSVRPRVLFGYARALFGSGDEGGGDALERARGELLGAGDAEGAAEADSLLAEFWWYRGERRRVDEHLERAATIMKSRAPSPTKARVLSAISRFRMLGDELRESSRVAQEALELAEAFDLTEVRAHTLVTLGTVKWYEDDFASGLADVELGLELALDANALSAAFRGANNLAAFAGIRGDYVRRLELLLETERLAQRLGSLESLRSITSQLIDWKFRAGEWDEALARADEFIAECEAGSPHREESEVRILRGAIRLGRDDEEGAMDEAARAVVLARDVADLQNLIGTLASVLWMKAEVGRLDEARDLAAEIRSYEPAGISRFVFYELVWWMEELGLSSEDLEPYLEAIPPEFLFHRAAELAISGSFRELADVLTEIGYNEWAAHARLRAAQDLFAEGRQNEADEQFQKALAFYRRVGATRYIREAEALLAAAEPVQEQA